MAGFNLLACRCLAVPWCVVLTACGGLSIPELTAGESNTDGGPGSMMPGNGNGNGNGNGDGDDDDGTTGGPGSGGSGGQVDSGTVDPSTSTDGGSTPPMTSQTTMSMTVGGVTTDDDPTGGFEPFGFGDCINASAATACLSQENCVVDNPDTPTAAVCAQLGCRDTQQCPPLAGAPPESVACLDLVGDAEPECVVPCMFGQACPGGMVCVDELVCMWAEHGFYDCSEDPTVCHDDEECLVFDAPPWSVCSAVDCDGDPLLCPLPPPGGAGQVSCELDWDANGAADCTITCEQGQACPAGMSCQGDTLCAWVPGSDLACADANLGSAFGPAVVVGSTSGAGNDTTPPCTGSDADDVAFAWTSPADGLYLFSTSGSDFDTVLYAFEDCGGELLSCNDDAGGDVTSTISAFVDAGQTILIVVDGFGETGNFVLNVN